MTQAKLEVVLWNLEDAIRAWQLQIQDDDNPDAPCKKTADYLRLVRLCKQIAKEGT